MTDFGYDATHSIVKAKQEGFVMSFTSRSASISCSAHCKTRGGLPLRQVPSLKWLTSRPALRPDESDGCMSPEILAAYFESVSDSLPWWALFVGACIGHGYLFIVALNIFYGWPLPHWLLKFTRKLDLLIVMAGPVFFWYAMGIGFSWHLIWSPGSPRYYLSPYVVICWMVGFLVGEPVCELFYLMRRPARQLISQRGGTVDVEKELGYSLAVMARTPISADCR